ncbi:MAG TPA: RNA 2',3'-cyclic phosphodiesterase [Candidatus Angelobacter sp.]|nr:RNA 2',3'-cyclic phosphodiesterase [Candidatus Angelobacter sp.]
MRIFIALDIPAEIRRRLDEYMQRARSYAPDARWARVEGLHVTLKFVGEAGEELVEKIKGALARVKASPFEVKFEGVGGFPNPRSPRVFWAGVDGGEALPRLAAAIDAALEKLGLAREEKAYHPHLTLARATTHPLRELAPLFSPQHAQTPRALGAPQPGNGQSPQFGTMTAREFFMYQSKPQRGGSKYTKLERFQLE